MSGADSDEQRAETNLSGVLGDFFPPDDSISWWMYRLAVIRDDIAFEVTGLTPPSAPDDTDGVWRVSYFLRRISVSLLEAEGIFQADVGAFLKRQAKGFSHKEHQTIRKARETLATAKPALEVLRQAVGGHVRPANVDNVLGKHAKKKRGNDNSCAGGTVPPTQDKRPVEQRVLTEHGDWPCSAVQGHTLGETTYRHLSASALLFAWPDVKTPSQLDDKIGDVSKLVGDCVDAVLQAIDILLWGWWHERGGTTWAAPQ